MLALRIKLLYMTIILVLNKDKTFDFNSDDVNYNGTYSIKKDDNNIYVNGFNNISYIRYADYKNIVSNKEDALVVVTRNDCSFCMEYDDI